MDENLPKDNHNKPEDKTPEKKSFRQKWNAWWRLTWKSFVVEVEDRVLMSWKRIIKFVGIVLIPIIYGVICTIAFWNPIENIGRSELIVMDNDVSVLMVTDSTTTNNSSDNKSNFGKDLLAIGDSNSDKVTDKFNFGIASGFNGHWEENYIRSILMGQDLTGDNTFDKAKLRKTAVAEDDIVFFKSMTGGKDAPSTDPKKDTNLRTIAIKNSSKALENDVAVNKLTSAILDNIKADKNRSAAFNLTTGEEQKYSPSDAGFGFQITSAWQILKGAMLPKKDPNVADKNYTFETPIIEEQQHVALTNIKYSPDVDANNKNFGGTKGYMHALIPEGYTANLLNYVSYYLLRGQELRKAGDSDQSETLKNIDANLKSITNNMSGKPVKFWTTFERNFLFGYLFTAISGSLGTTVMGELPGVLNNGLLNNAGVYLTLDGARFKDLLSSLGDSAASEISDSDRYAVAESSSFPGGNEDNALELQSQSLFGDVNTKISNPTSKDIGGKFINTINNLIDLAKGSGIDDLAGLIVGGSNWDKIKNIVKAIGDIIKKNNPDKNRVDADGPFDAALVSLNEAAYNIFTGKKDESDVKYVDDVIAAVWQKLEDAKMIPKTDTPTLNINHANLFNDGSETTPDFVTLDVFSKNVDSFVKDNSTLFLGATTMNEVMPKIVNILSKTQLFGLNIDDIFDYGIQGVNAGIYGIGLGEFFLTIGLYVGCLLQTFIFDRAKRVNKAKWSNWYIAKYMLMLGIMAFQVTAEMWVVYAAGWRDYVTLTGMTYSWLWMLFNGFVFITIVQALWFIVKDESIGRFLCVLLLVFSLAAGGGTFPAYTQFSFFEVIGPLVPFTYTLQGLGEIVYGLSQNNAFGIAKTGARSLVVLKNFGCLWVYVAIFLPLGMLVGGRWRMKEMDYGSHYGYAVAGAMKALGKDTTKFQILRKVTKSGKKKFYYDWKALPKGFDPELYFQCRKMYKFEGEFKWWTRKHHDFVQKPNYSDEDTVTRNE